MEPYQKINHFPSMEELTHKDGLCRNMERMRSLAPNDYNFFPPSFQLPQDKQKFMEFYGKKTDTTIFISKPNASC